MSDHSGVSRNPCEPDPPAAAAKHRIVLVANKRWEADPVQAVLLEEKARPVKELEWPYRFTYRRPPPKKVQCVPTAEPRAVFRVGTADIEFWCLQDLMNPDVSSSSTEEKWKVLGTGIFGSNRPAADFVIALGTAAFPGEQSHNGCVVIGSRVFIHDPFDQDTSAGIWHDQRTGKVLESKVDTDFFNPSKGVVDDTLRAETSLRFLPPPVDPAYERTLIAAYNYTAVGVVNITNYDDYAWADPEALAAFEEKQDRIQKKAPVGSLETTHGLIRLQTEAPFLFVSGITDRVGSFNYEVASRQYTQNFVAAHNAGVATAWLLPRIVRFMGW